MDRWFFEQQNNVCIPILFTTCTSKLCVHALTYACMYKHTYLATIKVICGPGKLFGRVIFLGGSLNGDNGYEWTGGYLSGKKVIVYR